ncbi:MAG: AAA family ATPase [Pseudomonadota bacterium]|nr:AAA family ATPase [Pseudomonadota bacterium]
MIPIRLGLIGAHRCGKTTLAEALALRMHWPLIKTQVSQVFKQAQLQPHQPLDFATRLRIQTQILHTARENWQAEHFVTDRTPIDFMAYTLADIHGKTVVDMHALEEYLVDCFETINQIFTHLILLQPGIPLVYAPGKAALNKAYIEHLNTLMLGLCHDQRLHCPSRIIKRQILSLEERVQMALRIIDG